MEINIIVKVIIGVLLWMGVYTIISRICECFEVCSMYKAFKSIKEQREANKQENKKVTVEDLYPKE